jgi:hypothetical protein
VWHGPTMRLWDAGSAALWLAAGVRGTPALPGDVEQHSRGEARGMPLAKTGRAFTPALPHWYDVTNSPVAP